MEETARPTTPGSASAVAFPPQTHGSGWSCRKAREDSCSSEQQPVSVLNDQQALMRSGRTVYAEEFLVKEAVTEREKILLSQCRSTLEKQAAEKLPCLHW